MLKLKFWIGLQMKFVFILKKKTKMELNIPLVLSDLNNFFS